jgi:hypothetical protein
MLTMWAIVPVASAGEANELVGYRGRIVTSDVAIAAPVDSSPDSVAELVATLKRFEQTEPIAACCDGAWRVHFAAVLDRPARQDVLVLAFHDKDGARADPVFSTEVSVKREQPVVVLNDFVISNDLGFLAGHKYAVTLARHRGADREVLARGTFMLK